MTRPLQITVLSGTNRAGSRTLRVATALQGLYAALPGVSAQVLDLQRLPLEALSPDAYAQKPAALEPLTRAVLEGLHARLLAARQGFAALPLDDTLDTAAPPPVALEPEDA